MLTAKKVKEFAKKEGADLVGIASMDRFEGAPKQMDPRYIFPEAKALIVLGFRIPRGAFRGIEEGTHFANYPSMGYAAINQVYGPMILWKLTRFIEDEGYEAVPHPNINGGEATNPVTGKFRKDWSIPVSQNKPYPDVLVHYKITAFCAGLGEIGYSGLFLTPEFGPRQRFNLCFTDAPLEPDPLYGGPPICDRCMLCVRDCIGKAISKDKTVKVKIAGRTLEWGEFDPYACEKGLQGGRDKSASPFLREYPRFYGYGRAIGGARGCIRACMIHLENKGILKNKFHSPFRKKKLWVIEHNKKQKFTRDIMENYIKKGKVEESSEYINYNIKENYGIKGKNSSGDWLP